jgi:hypothetical protein
MHLLEPYRLLPWVKLPTLSSNKYFMQHCFICRPSDSAVSEDAGNELRTVATS